MDNSAFPEKSHLKVGARKVDGKKTYFWRGPSDVSVKIFGFAGRPGVEKGREAFSGWFCVCQLWELVQHVFPWGI